jgi:outer membrane protein OmpA-like peptidoglycan-associated protein
MNTTLSIPRRSLKSLTVAAAVSCVLAACATTPQSPEGAAEVRSKLTRLQSDPNLADRAPLAIQEAETAVHMAEEPVGKDVALGAHRVYFADRKVEIAIAQASTRYAEDQRETLTEERERARLAARTREADRARADADAARAGAADAARLASADAARAADAAAAATLEAAELQRQIDELQAKETDRGLVLTLGDVLFTSGQADLKAGVASNLGRLATFLHQNPGRNVEIEGHTDSVGSDEYCTRQSINLCKR